MQMKRLRSRAVAAVGYDAALRTLRIRFHNGGIYDYLDVPPNVFAKLTAAAHPWTQWGAQIKQTYRYHRLK